MGVTFFALILSSMLLMKEFGLVLSFAVLLDTFIIRTMVVPSLLHLFREFDWWPRKFAVQYSDYDEYQHVMEKEEEGIVDDSESSSSDSLYDKENDPLLK